MDTANKPMYEWETINWSKTQRLVFKLQKESIEPQSVVMSRQFVGYRGC